MVVVVASINARATIRASLGRFLEEVEGRGEVILVDASRDGTADEAERAFPHIRFETRFLPRKRISDADHGGSSQKPVFSEENGFQGHTLRVIRSPAGRLAPELWSDGLRATNASFVAFSTAQMVPSPGWLDALRKRLDATSAAVAGGPIEPSSKLSASDRALYLLRYVNYLRPLPDSDHVEPPGDNALYRREALRGLEPLWESGFWEVEVHRALRARGERLTMATEAAVEFVGGARLAESLRQRQNHARHYGAARAGRMGTIERVARSAAAPIVPAVLLRRIAETLAARGRKVAPWLPALPTLSLLLAAWSLGEAAGTWQGSPRKVA